MYPKLPDLIKYLHTLKNTKSVFLVTNGQEPEMLQRLIDEDALPTQLYLSTNASNKKMFSIINRPRYRDAWERWQKSLELLSEMNTRTVLRMTLIRNFNESTSHVNEFAELMKRGNPHFIEIKSYMHIGMSTQRLERSDMLEMDEIRNYSNLLCKSLFKFTVMDASEISRIVVLQNLERFTERWIEGYEKPLIQ
jgi:tRNA wybutosine-synthesizing protein 1